MPSTAEEYDPHKPFEGPYRPFKLAFTDGEEGEFGDTETAHNITSEQPDPDTSSTVQNVPEPTAATDTVPQQTRSKTDNTVSAPTTPRNASKPPADKKDESPELTVPTAASQKSAPKTPKANSHIPAQQQVLANVPKESALDLLHRAAQIAVTDTLSEEDSPWRERVPEVQKALAPAFAEHEATQVGYISAALSCACGPLLAGTVPPNIQGDKVASATRSLFDFVHSAGAKSGLNRGTPIDMISLVSGSKQYITMSLHPDPNSPSLLLWVCLDKGKLGLASVLVEQLGDSINATLTQMYGKKAGT